MKTTKLLTVLALLIQFTNANSQCDLITANGSTQMPSGVCVPVTFGMEAHYEFLIPVDTSLVQILFRWNDAANTETYVSGNWNTAGDSIWASETHVYPPDNECSKTAEAIIVYDGEICESSGYQSQLFATWGTDDENSGELLIEPITYYVCEGVDVFDFTFSDNSTFNCNVNIEHDRPNRIDRWTQFIYNTYTQSGDRIPNVTIRDGVGIVHTMTDAIGNFTNDLNGPINQIPYPADGPTETSYAISAPTGGVAGDIFEITLKNWNVCNPYDNNPSDGIPPVDPINGDNPPILTQARIEIIAPVPVTVPNLFEYCTGDNIILNASAGSAEIRWYKDINLDTLLYIGQNFNPTLAPTSIDPNLAGHYSFYVTTFQGICESAPKLVELKIYQSPNLANANIDQTICADSIYLAANTPTAGTAVWSTSSLSTIDNINSPNTLVKNLEFGPNVFTWTISNGPCATSDNVTIFSDRQPMAANAGSDKFVCDIDTINLKANIPTDMGAGQWNIVKGNGVFSNNASPISTFYNTAHDTNILVWRVSSRYNACPVTYDSIYIATDYSAGDAIAGTDIFICEDSIVSLFGNPPANNGKGYWIQHSGLGSFSDSNSALSDLNGVAYGYNKVTWNLQSKLEICPISSDTLLIRRDKSPGIANAGIDKAFCFVTQDTLAANSPVIGAGTWRVIQNPTSIPPSFSPNNTLQNAVFSILPGNEGEYGLEWELKNGVCRSTDTVIIDFGVPVPQAIAGNDTVACGYDFEMQGNSIAIGKGTWSIISGPGIVSYNPNENTPNAVTSFNPGNEGVYNFEWRFTSGSCPSTSDTVEIEITVAPLPPTLTDMQSCGSDTFSINVPNGNARNVAYWYTSDTISNNFYKGNLYETALLSTSESYFIKLKDTITLCESPRVPLNIVIDEIPVAPALIGDTLCKPGQAIIYGSPSAPANTVVWYQQNNGTAIDTNSTLIVDTLSSSKYFYAKALNSITGCSSEIDSVFNIVYPEIPAPISYNDSACGSTTFILHADKSMASNSLFWYDSENNLLNINDSMPTGLIDTSTFYTVTEYNSTTRCFSNSSLLNIKINAIPEIPVLRDTTSCGSAFFTMKPIVGSNTTTFRWYDSPIATTLFAEEDSLESPLLVGNTSYWAAGYNSNTGCEGEKAQTDISIFPSPAAIDILGPTLVLEDQTDVVFFTINGQTGSTYNWDIPGDIIVESNMNDFVRLAFPNTGTFTISATETTINGCVGTPEYHSITVIKDSIAVDIAPYNQSACTEEVLEIKPWLFGGTAPYIYKWTGDVAYLNSTNTLFTNFTPPGIGSYKLYLEVVDVNLKKAVDSVLITVYESPTTTILNVDTVACVDENYTINTSSVGAAPFTHAWSGAIHRLNNFTLANPIYTPRTSDTTEYFYTLTDVNGCHAYDSITIVSDEPVADFNILTDPGCSPLPVSFEDNSENAISYNWQFGSLGNSTQENPNFTFINSSPEIKYVEVELDVESPLGCRDNTTKYVMVWPNPVADITALPQNSCNPAHTLLVSSPGNRFYHWNFGDSSSDTTSGNFNTYHTYVNTGLTDITYTARVITESSLNCTDTAFLDITVYATPEADFQVNPEEAYFPDNGFKVENLTVNNWKYKWDFGDGTGSSIYQPDEKFYAEPGYYPVSLIVSGAHCNDSITRNIRLHPAKPIALFKGATSGCMPHTVNLVNNSSYATKYLWDFGDGNISTAKDPSYTYYESGIYKIKLKVTGPGGEDIFSDTSRVHILPNSFFDLAPRYVYVNDEPVHFFNLSDHADNFEWDFGDGNTSTELNPQHVYSQEGTYDISLKVWTINNCYDLYVMENSVLVEPSGIVQFPDAFRPNSGIEENSVFSPGVIDHVDNYHLMIFNRWGELVFESFSQEVGWDGYYNGEIAKQDVYIWKLKGNYTDGKGFIKTGNVTLLY